MDGTRQEYACGVVELQRNRILIRPDSWLIGHDSWRPADSHAAQSFFPTNEHVDLRKSSCLFTRLIKH